MTSQPAYLHACLDCSSDFIPSKVPLQLAHSFGTKEYHRKRREAHHHQLCPPLRSDVDLPIGELLRIYPNSRDCVAGVSSLFYPMPLQLLQCQCSLRVFGVTTYLIRLDFHIPCRLFPPSGRGWLPKNLTSPVCRWHHRWELWSLSLHGTHVEASCGQLWFY